MTHPSSPDRGPPSSPPLASPWSGDALLDAYLDGTLSSEEREAFEHRIANSPDLRRIIAAQHEVDAALLAGFGPRTEPLTPPLAIPKPVRSNARLRLYALAATITLLLTGFVAFEALRPDNPMVLAYRTQVASGFVPDIVSTTPEAFCEWTTNALQEPMIPANLPASIQLLGWSKTNLLSNYSGVLLARVEGREVIVVMDSTRNTPPISTRSQDGIRVFESKIGIVRLVEISPFSAPKLIPHLQQAPGG